MRRYCIIQENDKINRLLSVIKTHYKAEYGDCLIQEVNLSHVINKIYKEDIKTLVKNLWQDLELKLGYEMRLLEVNSKVSILHKFNKKARDLCFIVKIRADITSETIFDSIYTASDLKVQLRAIKV
ncbi:MULTISPECIES: normocyte binding protein 2b [unclassified Francisella]|uniref:normocyte binding protein 2b n=1 Tax=unclassified Francisella TaxID=2610885 RepID=UPI002E37A6A5|nr:MULTISPECIES: normocyte binding protein 2b [unclassified Francisella]MED7819361.1 normocyte binding protein 2b [Francisella sp. 19S2-4]MED7830182.1 normocyte binding protein 2b [Francisella sp. 19S2-10]